MRTARWTCGICLVFYKKTTFQIWKVQVYRFWIIWIVQQIITNKTRQLGFVCLDQRSAGGKILVPNTFFLLVTHISFKIENILLINLDRTFHKQPAFQIRFCFYATIKVNELRGVCLGIMYFFFILIFLFWKKFTWFFLNKDY